MAEVQGGSADACAAPHPPDASPHRKVHENTAALAIGALGVVYGDIGTSPLYTVRECFNGPHAVAINPTNLLGVASLIFWSLIIVVSVKYVGFRPQGRQPGRRRHLRVAGPDPGVPQPDEPEAAFRHHDRRHLRRLSALRGGHHHAVHLGAVRHRRPRGRHRSGQALRRATDLHRPGGALLGPTAGHQRGRSDLRPRHGRVVSDHRRHGNGGHPEGAPDPSVDQPLVRVVVFQRQPAARVRGPRLGGALHHGLRGAVRRPRSLRLQGHPRHLAGAGAPVPAAELLRPVRPAAGPAGCQLPPILCPGPLPGALPHGGPCRPSPP